MNEYELYVLLGQNRINNSRIHDGMNLLLSCGPNPKQNL